MRRIAGAVLAAGLTLAGCAGGPGGAPGDWTRFEDDASADVAVTEIQVSGGAGSVEVHAGAASGVEIHRTVRYAEPVRDRPGETHRIEGSTLHLEQCGNNCAVDYVVDAPDAVAVAGHVDAGNLRLEAVGPVDVSTDAGNITLTEVTGDITARSDAGSIEGQELESANIDTAVSAGEISLDLAAPANVRAETQTGEIDVTVPTGDYQVDTDPGEVGSADVDIPHDPAASHHLDLRTTVGSITATYR